MGDREELISRIERLEDDKTKLIEKIAQQAEWSKSALKAIDEIKKNYNTLVTEVIPSILTQIATLKVKAGIFGVVGAMIPVSFAIVLDLVKGGWISKAIGG